MLLDINQDSEWLIRLVENLLSLTRLDEGKLPLEKNLEALEEIVSEAIRRVSKRASEHHITLTIPDKLILIPMDGSLILQVIINLIDNALKYTPKGTEITVNVVEKKDQVIFEIGDNGPGIPEAALPNIFDRFFTTNTKTGDTRRGIGLGLPSVSLLSKLMAGQSTREINPTVGQSFVL